MAHCAVWGRAPGASDPTISKDAIKGVVELPGSGSGDEAGVALSVSTTAAPDGGAANTAIVATLAKALGVPKSAVRIAAGGTSRVKRVEIDTPDVDKLIVALKDVCG